MHATPHHFGLILALPLILFSGRLAAADATSVQAGSAPRVSPRGRDISYNVVTTVALSPEEQQRTFQLPSGFEIELVAAETEGIGKFIGLAWDASMRLWTMTALEYPVDGNEQKAASDALFARGGRDKVLVFDSPYGEAAPGRPAVTTPPRVFADGLVMPLGLLPYRDGAYVQYGADIRFYRDTDGDGRADTHDVILTGFGTQDSHLFPHQFLRQPGGDVFLAQGLFNYSKVRRPDNRPFADGFVTIAFDQCKLARFSLDGSRFETLTAGPNNIWGLLTSRDGETFLQEANDYGHAVIPYAPGILVRTGSSDRLRPYQALMPPPLGEQRMGGTGLSGLALAEDRDGLFRRAGAPKDVETKVFFLANPIANSIQLVRGVHDGVCYRFEKLPDFLTTSDRWFRPIALHFGPDGALYIVDWYNKIISHNEVPRAHPDRDKTRGRIWRIRHRDQPRVVPPDLTKLDSTALLAEVGGSNALVSRLAWLEIIDRKATEPGPELHRLAADREAPIDRRLGALWALEGVSFVPTSLLRTIASDPAFALRREAVRIAAAQPRSEIDFLEVVGPRIVDPHPSVRSASGDALRRVRNASPRVMVLAAQLGGATLDSGDECERYQRDFERFLARWAMETNPAATRAMLESAESRRLSLENRILATLALGGRDAAVQLVALTAGLPRPLNEEEVRTMAAHAAETTVRAALVTALTRPDGRRAVLRALRNLRPSIDAAPLTPELTSAARALLTGDEPADVTLAAEVAGGFRLAPLERELVSVLERSFHAGSVTPPGLAVLRALREMGAGPPALFENLARKARAPAARNEAIAALAASHDPAAPSRLVALLPALTPQQRGNALDRLASTSAGAIALRDGLQAGTLAKADIGIGTVEKLRTLLPDDAQVAALWRELGGEAESAMPAEKFAHFRQLATARGNPEAGKALFTAICLGCHQQGGKGGNLAPHLDGLALTGIDAVLRNLLTPSAAMESAYRIFRVVTRDGRVEEGFLVAETGDSFVLRIPGADDRSIPRADVRSSSWLNRSLMPEGLLEGMAPHQVTDLFAYLMTLR